MGEDKVYLPWAKFKQTVLEAQVLSFIESRVPRLVSSKFALSCDKCQVSYWMSDTISIAKIATETTYHIRRKHPTCKSTDEEIYTKARLLVRWRETKRGRVISDSRPQTEFTDI